MHPTQLKNSDQVKGMKGIILAKLQSMPHIGLQKPGRILQLRSTPPPICHFPDQSEAHPERSVGQGGEDKENVNPTTRSRSPATPWRKQKKKGKSNHKSPPFRRPVLSSSTLFDPNLLAAFEQAVNDYFRIYERVKQFKDRKDEHPWNAPLNQFEEKCPPGGEGTVIFYTTSLRGVRKTFEGCSAVRFLLQSSKVLFYERDVSMHMEFRADLQRLLGFRAIPPRLFVGGRYIGGAEEVLWLHEQGRLMPILNEMPRDQSGGVACWRCDGARFLVCERCDGRRRLRVEIGGVWDDCDSCNENGLVVCPLCCR